MTTAGCAPIVVVLPVDALDEGKARIGAANEVIITAGGDTRQQSVARGLAYVDTEKVVVHDAARPFATDAMVRAVLEELREVDAAITAIPVSDTVKRASEGTVENTVRREDLYLSQTPQAFNTEVLRLAHRRAEEEGYSASDDAELVERYGGKVRFVPGSRLNLKITSAADFQLAESIARVL
jgi:2-C-methyl-D-erythritol 4-phosphate cytidylyltransferase